MIPCYFCKSELFSVWNNNLIEGSFECHECIVKSPFNTLRHSKFQIEISYYANNVSKLKYIYIDLNKLSIASWASSNYIDISTAIYDVDGNVIVKLPMLIGKSLEDILLYSPQELLKKIELYILMS